MHMCMFGIAFLLLAKPDVKHLRVWGCTAYVYIQKDKRKSLQPHMEKCVFIGYPAGYKGWLFYNPTTKKTIISEWAEFDEHYFPGLRAPPHPAPPPAPLPFVDLTVKPQDDDQDSDSDSVLDFGGDEDYLPYVPVTANPAPEHNAPAPASIPTHTPAPPSPVPPPAAPAFPDLPPPVRRSARNQTRKMS
jgi:hypothetical protein